MEIKERKFLIWLEEYLKQPLPRDVIDKTAFYAGYDEGYKDAVFDMQEKLNAAIEVIKFYADPDNWQDNEMVNELPNDENIDAVSPNTPWHEPVMVCGKRARDFLKARGK